MDNPYKTDAGALSWLEFMNSNDGATFRQVLGDAILARLGKGGPLEILDAACGNGWLSSKLFSLGHRVQGCDISPMLIDYAKTNWPKINFFPADLTKNPPVTGQQFDVITLCMATVDFADLNQAMKNLYGALKAGGKLVAIIPNPYYAYPVGVWKRGCLGFLLRQKPKLKLRPFGFFARRPERGFDWNEGRLSSKFYSLPEQLNAAWAAGFRLNFLTDITPAQDSKKYDLTYRLHRFPVFMLLEFLKP